MEIAGSDWGGLGHGSLGGLNRFANELSNSFGFGTQPHGNSFSGVSKLMMFFIVSSKVCGDILKTSISCSLRTLSCGVSYFFPKAGFGRIRTKDFHDKIEMK